MSNPFIWMSTLNILAGSFSAIAGARKAIAQKSPWPIGKQATTANPWMYVIGGTLTALIGIGNGMQFSWATWGTVIFIYTSIQDGWFGPGRKDFRFYTLTLYSLFQSAFVLWSTQLKSPFSLP